MRERTFQLDRIKTESIRKQKGEQSRIASVMGISSQRLNNWLCGRKGIPETYLHQLSYHCGLPYDKLLQNVTQNFLVSPFDKIHKTMV